MDTHKQAMTPGGCGAGASGSLLPADPFTAMQFHFGMLLGVDDLETLDGQPRGKLRLHNAWLHREGVLWGLGVRFVAERGELLVEPGVAVDGAGRELRLEAPSCVGLAAWFAAHADEFDALDLEPDEAGRVTVQAHVVARFKACLSRPVPAIAEPCSNEQRDVAYSRAVETVDLFLRPGPAPAAALPYPRLRVLFGVKPPEGPEELAVAARREAIRAAPAEEQPGRFLEALRQLAALDTIALGPKGADGEVGLFPEPDTTSVLLADVQNLVFRKEDDAWVLDLPAGELVEVDVQVRPSHVATHTLQELLAGALACCPAAAAPAPAEPEPPEEPEEPAPEDPLPEEPLPEAPLPEEPDDEPGPEAGAPEGAPFAPPAFSTEVGLAPRGRRLSLTATAPLSRPSVTREAFVVSSYHSRLGWAEAEVKAVTLERDGMGVRLDLAETLRGEWVRVIARGTGSRPIVSVDAGRLRALNGGRDFVHTFRRG